MKNIPQASNKEYVMKFTHQVTKLYWGMCWHAAIVLGIISNPHSKETYGFNTLKPPPKVPQLETRIQKLNK